MKADYLIGETSSRCVVRCTERLALDGDPGLYGQPDHYSKGISNDDNGGVHINQGISNQPSTSPSKAERIASESECRALVRPTALRLRRSSTLPLRS